jgi:hypothetical protein
MTMNIDESKIRFSITYNSLDYDIDAEFLIPGADEEGNVNRIYLTIKASIGGENISPQESGAVLEAAQPILDGCFSNIVTGGLHLNERVRSVKIESDQQIPTKLAEPAQRSFVVNAISESIRKITARTHEISTETDTYFLCQNDLSRNVRFVDTASSRHREIKALCDKIFEHSSDDTRRVLSSVLSGLTDVEMRRRCNSTEQLDKLVAGVAAYVVPTASEEDLLKLVTGLQNVFRSGLESKEI